MVEIEPEDRVSLLELEPDEDRRPPAVPRKPPPVPSRPGTSASVPPTATTPPPPVVATAPPPPVVVPAPRPSPSVARPVRMGSIPPPPPPFGTTPTPGATRSVRPASVAPPPPASLRAGATGPSTLRTVPLGAMPAVAAPTTMERREAPPSAVEAAAQARAELVLRAERLRNSDPLGAARVMVEVGVLEERVVGDVQAARGAYEQARMLSAGLTPALTRRRRLMGPRDEQLGGALDEELRATTNDERRADLMSARAWLQHASGRLPDARGAHQEALRLHPTHASSLRGLGAVLEDELAQGSKTAAAELEAHLMRQATAYQGEGAIDGDARLVAWLQVERAQLLDQRLNQPDQALAALRRAVALQPLPSPVRDALTRFHVTHRQEAALVESLAEEAEFETDNERSARLLYTAARLRTERLKQPTESVGLLTMALGRSAPGGATRQRVLLELCRLHEEAGRLEAAAQSRTQLLIYAAEPPLRAQEHARLFELYSSLGRLDEASQQARQALDLDPTELAARERLDEVLREMGRHEQRLALWNEVARSEQPTEARREALVRAAEVAEHALRRPAEAVALLRAAWALAPGDARVFEALAPLLTPPPREADDARGVRERLELFTAAARTAEDAPRRIALLERVASIWEDELYQPARATEALQQVLAIDPQRRTAILALQRTAQQASDAAQLVRALVLEVDTSTDATLRRRLLLRAAEITRDRLDDRAAAFQLLERAESLDPNHPDVLRARATHARLAGRHDEARKALHTLLSRHPKLDVFALWIEIARIDEHQRKNPRDAVASYRQAARLRPGHPLPPVEIARLLRQLGDPRALVEALSEIASAAPSPADQQRYLIDVAEVQELALNDDDGALRSLARAAAVAAPPEPLLFEASERILLRRGPPAELLALYRRWIAASPPSLAQRLRVALALHLPESQRAEAIEVLQLALSESRDLVPALRLLRHLLRRARQPGALVPLLGTEADVLRSSLARRGTLWEMASLEEHAGEPATLAYLERIARENPRDAAALDGALRLATRLHTRDEPTFNRLRAALQERRELIEDPLDRAFFLLEEAIVSEQQDDATNALAGYRAALDAYPGSLLAARGLARLAARANAREVLVLAEISLGSLVDAPAERALHLVRAADLVRGLPGQRSPVELYEQALTCDPDCASAATSLALLLSQDPARLVSSLSPALERAQSSSQILFLGSEIGRVILQHVASGAPGAPSAGVGIAAVQRALAQSPDTVSLLLLRARLEAATGLWPEARATLRRVLDLATDRETKITAHFELADLHLGPLQGPAQARLDLEAILALDEGNRRALETLRRLGQERGDLALVTDALSRLAEHAPDHASRVDYDLQLADTYQSVSDTPRQIHALADAILFAGSDPRPWDTLARLFRTSTREGATAYADALELVLRLADQHDVPLAPRWLSTLGMLEATVLFKPSAVEHLRRATQLPSSTSEERALLGQGLEVLGQDAEAVRTLRELLAERDGLLTLANPNVALASLEAALAKGGHAEQQAAAQEVRACLGAMPEDWMTSVRNRRLPPGALAPASLTSPELSRLLPAAARTPLVAVATALAPIAAKVLGFAPSSLGLSSRERISPRDGHPTRALADRVARALGIESFEFYLASAWPSAARVYPGDPPLFVAPASFAELPELEQTATLVRNFTRLALGLPFLDDMPLESLDGLLFAALCAAEPTLASVLPAPRERAAQSFLPSVQRAIGRRQRKQIEEVAASVAPSTAMSPFVAAVRAGEHRVAYASTGALLSTIDAMLRVVPGPPLRQPLAVDLLRFALTEEAAADRARLGAL